MLLAVFVHSLTSEFGFYSSAESSIFTLPSIKLSEERFFPSNQEVEEREANLFAAQLIRIESLFKPRIKPLNPAFESFEQDHLLPLARSYFCSTVLASRQALYVPSSSLSSINEESKAETDLRR